MSVKIGSIRILRVSSAFILLEFLVGIIILGIITVAGSKMLTNTQKYRFFQEQTLQVKFEMQNALDSIKNYLVNASRDSIAYDKKFLSWENADQTKKNLIPHRIYIENNKLLFDEFLMFFPANSFEIKVLNENNKGYKNLELKLCSFIFKKLVCTQKLVRLWSNQ